MEVYKCSECNSEIKQGTKYCSECGAKLEWPSEIKTAKVIVEEKREKEEARPKKKDVVRLKVDPLAVDYLYAKSLGLGICLLFLGFLGIIFAPIILYQRYVIGKWLSHLMDPNNEKISTDRMIGRVVTIRYCCAFVFAFNLIFGLTCLFMPDGARGAFGVRYDFTAIKVYGFLANTAGIIVAEILSRRAIKVLRSESVDGKYEFDRNKKYVNYNRE